MRMIKDMHNRIRLCMDYLLKRSVLQGFPNELVLELTNHCNLNCATCPHDLMQRPKGFMAWELIEKILEEAQGKVELIDLDMFGESLMHPRFFDIVKRCRELGMVTELNTNMSWESRDLLDQLAAEGPDIIVLSVDGATRETYESVRVGADWDKVIANTEYFLSLPSKSYTALQMVVSGHTEHEVEAFLKRWKGIASHIRLHPYEALRPDGQDLAVNPSGAPLDKPCILVWRKIAVSWDGVVVPCCADFDCIHPLGNANQESLAEIWNGAALQAFRKLHLSGRGREIKLCKHCNGFSASLPIVLGSVFVSAYASKKILHHLDNLTTRTRFHPIHYA